MKKENKAYLAVYVNNETKDRFMKIKKECPLRNDAFINYLLNLYEGKGININQQKEGNDNDK